MKISGMKIISLFTTLLILFCLVPNSAFAEEDGAEPPFASDEEAFDLMKSRMTESISSMIENLEDSKEDLDEDLLDEAEELITELELVNAELEDVETDSEMLDIRIELDSLIEEASDELKDVLGSAGQGMSFGSERLEGASAPGQGFEAGSERDPSMMQNRSEMKDGNVPGEDGTPEDRKMREQSSGEMEGNAEGGNAEGGNAEETGSENAGFFGKLINSIRSLFS